MVIISAEKCHKWGRGDSQRCIYIGFPIEYKSFTPGEKSRQRGLHCLVAINRFCFCCCYMDDTSVEVYMNGTTLHIYEVAEAENCIA